MEEEFELVMLSLCDFKLIFVPDYVINFLVRKFSFSLIEKLISMGKGKKIDLWEK